VPVYAVNLSDVGAITLYIGFDSTNLAYISLENINSHLTGASYNYIASPSHIAIAWSNTVGVNYTQDKLFDIKFYSSKKDSTLRKHMKYRVQILFCFIVLLFLVHVGAALTNEGAIEVNPPQVNALKPNDTISEVSGTIKLPSSGDQTFAAKDTLELYTQLIEKAVKGLKGEEVKEEITPEIHFHLPAFIPEAMSRPGRKVEPLSKAFFIPF
jgi:hypothetical protein